MLGREWYWELLVLLFPTFNFCFLEELMFSYSCSSAGFSLRCIPLTLTKISIFLFSMSSSFSISSFLDIYRKGCLCWHPFKSHNKKHFGSCKLWERLLVVLWKSGWWVEISLTVSSDCVPWLEELNLGCSVPPFLHLLFIRVLRSATGRLACTKCANDNCRYKMHVKPLTNGNLE